MSTRYNPLKYHRSHVKGKEFKRSYHIERVKDEVKWIGKKLGIKVLP
jgi:hypothetical protein